MIRVAVIALLALGTADALAQTDPRGDWRTWRTTHFQIHARAEHAAMATRAAREAEHAHAELSRELRPPRGPIHVVLFDNTDYSNGFATVVPYNRIGIYLTPGAGEPGLGLYDDWLRLVITHELTHVFHLDRAGGVWALAQAALGRAPGLFPNEYRPAWVTEGLATYYESRLTSGGRLRAGFHTQLLVAAQEGTAGRWPGPGDLAPGSPRWPDGITPYAWGSRFFEWASATYGATVVPRFIEAMSGRLWPFDVSVELDRAGGERLGTAWSRFKASVTVHASAAAPATVMARGLWVSPRPQLSPDGRRLAFARVDGRSREHLLIVDAASGAELARHRVNAGPEFAWIGDDLVVAQLDFGAPVEVLSRLRRWSPPADWRAASGVARLVRPFALPDAGIGAVQLGDGLTRVVRLVGDTAVAPVPVPPGDAWSRVTVSPDDRWMAGARHLNARWDLVLWPVGHPDHVRTITDDAAIDDDPAWSPDGSSLLFVSERTGVPQVFALRLETGATQQLTDEPAGARQPVLGPDGMLYYSTLYADGYALVRRRSAPVPAAPAVSDPPAVAPSVAVEVRESGYSPWRFLVPRWWFPTVQRSTAGTFVGALTGAADPTGRWSYGAVLLGAVDRARWQGAVVVTYTRWGAVGLDATARQSWGSGGSVRLSDGRVFRLSERDRAVGAGLTVRHRRWRSEVAARVGGEVEQDAFFAPDSAGLGFTNPLLGGGVISFRAVHADRRPFSISAENGAAVTALYRRRWAVNGPGWSDEVRGSVRGYLALPLPGFARWVVAARTTGVVSRGPLAPGFSLGGVSGEYLRPFPGVTVGRGPRDFELRGYPRGPGAFTRVSVSTAELRVPLFLIARGIGRLPLTLDRVALSLFGQAGGGWQAGDAVRPAAYRTIGAELVTDVEVNESPFRVRAGVARGLSTWLDGSPGRTRWYVVVGPGF